MHQRLLTLLAIAGCVSACGGGSSALPTDSIGGSVSGLAGSGLILRLNGGSRLPIAANGSFVFAGTVTRNSSYSVTVETQPTSLSQTCTVTNGSGTATANVTNVAVACSTNRFSVGGVTSGLAGTGLMLQINSGETAAVAGAGFTFPTSLLSGSSYSVSIVSQPESPWQTCSLSNSSGVVTSGHVSGIVASCTTNTYSLSGTVNGLVGSGLEIGDTASPALSIAANGSFMIPAQVASGASYSVRAVSVPTSPAQECVTLNGAGVVANAPITDIVVNCFLVGRWMFVTNSSTSTLSVASIDQQTGVLTPAAGSPYPTNTPIGNVATPDGRLLYVANRPNRTVSGYAIDRATGELSPVPGSPAVAGPMLGPPIIDAAGRFLYSPDGTGLVFSYRIDAVTGELTAIPGSPFGPFGASVIGMKVESTGRFAYVYSQADPPLMDTGRLFGFAINQATGALTELPGALTFFPAGRSGDEQMAISSGNDTLYVSSAFMPSLRAYRLDTISGTFAEVPGSPQPIGVFNGGTNVLPGIPAVYVSGDRGIAVYTAGSSLQELPGSPFAVTGFGTRLASDPSARFLWASTRSSFSPHSLGEFLVQRDGTLVARGSRPTLFHMGSLIADPSGRFIFGADPTTGTMTVMSVDRDTGALAEVSGSTFNPGAGFLRITITR